MSQITNPTTTGEVVVFKPRLYLQIIGYITAAFVALIFPLCYLGYCSLSPVNTSGSPWGIFIGAVILGFIMLGFSLWAYLGTAGQRLVIGPGGIIYRSGTRKLLVVTWDAIVGYGSVNPGNGSKLTGFFVDATEVKENGLLEALVVLKPILLIIGLVFGFSRATTGTNLAFGISDDLSYRRLIPLNIFSKHWDEEEMGDLIASYCPRLFIPKTDPHDHSVIEGEIPVPNRRQPESLQPPDLSYLKDKIILPLSGLLTLAVILVLGAALLFLKTRGGF